MPGSANTRPVRILTASVAGLLVLGVPSVAHAATTTTPARYSIVELSTPTGGYSYANAINNAGVVVGSVDVSGTGTQPVRWSATGVRADLPGPSGGRAATANGINDAGQVTGSYTRADGGYAYPVRWSAANVPQVLGDQHVNRLGYGSALDPRGVVAGGQRPADSEMFPLGIVYALDGTPTELGPDFDVARGINGYDQVVGAPGYVWKSGAVTYLPGLDGTTRSSAAYAINDAGSVVGAAPTPGGFGTNAVYWSSNGVITDLGTVDGAQYNAAKSINGAGQVVGSADPKCQPCAPARAWIWQSGTPATPLDTLLPVGSGWTLRDATGINDRGEIVGTGLHNGQIRAFKMTPTYYTAINFQPSSAAVPPGYLADGGAVYADRGNGRTYGWNIDGSPNVRDRNSAAAPDQRYDTLTHMQKSGGATRWELAVPNGTYTVHIVAGDTDNVDSIYKIAVESTVVVSGTPTTAKRFIEGSARVTVTDGRLTVSNAAGSSNNKINLIEVLGS
ncbi:DUF3466 family protein [Cellulomonas sp. URHD0024]|uniref:DUF3466 family protein n=1 Tax=Cellulomonas sp. URHD0024 TaxID=1302620 RepID=UPI0004247E7E|nr:DUF3466 family protein [Cellulomonas sp. URHD0024]